MEALQNRVRGDPRKHGVARNGVVFQLTALCLCLYFWYFMFDRHIQGSDREGTKVDGQPVQLALLPEFEDIPNGMQSRQRATALHGLTSILPVTKLAVNRASPVHFTCSSYLIYFRNAHTFDFPVAHDILCLNGRLHTTHQLSFS